MEINELKLLLPHVILAAGAIIVMLFIAIKRNPLVSFLLCLAGLGLSFASLFYVHGLLPATTDGLLVIDSLSLIFEGLIIFASLAVTIMSYQYYSNYPDGREEFYILILLATLGALVIIASNHFATLFLGFELLSVSLYVLIGFSRHMDFSIEGGLKYLILAAVSSAFLLFGMALVYSETGTMSFPGLSKHFSMENTLSLIEQAGFTLIFAGIAFKLALAPFHMWTPDVYQGAPAPVTALIASVSKGGIFAALYRIFSGIGIHQEQGFLILFIVLAVASMFAGNILALMQKNVKRLMAYSSIAHLGYLMITLLVGKSFGLESAIFYLLTYFVTILGAFGVITMMGNFNEENEKLDDYRGLFYKRPMVAIIFSAMMLSLAGIPLTAGFMGKFYLVLAGMEGGLITLVILLVINSVISLFYYLRVMVTMFSNPNDAREEPKILNISTGGAMVVYLLFSLVIMIGIVPDIFIKFIQSLLS